MRQLSLEERVELTTEVHLVYINSMILDESLFPHEQSMNAVALGRIDKLRASMKLLEELFQKYDDNREEQHG